MRTHRIITIYDNRDELTAISSQSPSHSDYSLKAIASILGLGDAGTKEVGK